MTGASFRPAEAFELSADLRYESARWEDDLNSRRLSDGVLVDARASWRFAENAELYLAAESDLQMVLGHIDEVQPGLVVVDSVQLMRGRGAREKRDEVDRAAEGMVRLARENDVAVLLLSQLSRESERRDDKRPLLSDLRESGTLEQVADAVFMVHQEWLYLNLDSKHSEVQAAYRKAFGIADLLVRKNKHGRRGDLKLRWNATTATYQNARLADRY